MVVASPAAAARRTRPLGVCVALAFGLHAAAAWVATAGNGAPTATGALADRPRVASLLTREILLEPAPADPAPAPAPHKQVWPIAAERSPPSHAADAATAAVATGLPEANGADRYVPRPELTLPPVAGSAPLLTYPEDGPPRGLYVARLALYIDESGVVRRVEPDGERLPAALEQAARQAFLATPFSPGQVEGVSVKSLIRIEVTFESRDRPAPAALPQERMGEPPG